jgi:two-component system OmpR family sensor kinase
MFKRMSLRARLVLGVIVLAAIGLIIADVATYTSLRSFLIHRTDTTLAAEHTGIENVVLRGDRDGGGDGGRGPSPIPPTEYVEVRSLDGTVIYRHGATRFPDGAAKSPPRLPETFTLPAASGPGGDRVRYLTVRAQDGGERYRVRVAIEGHTNAILIIGTSLSGVDSTLHRLLLIELLVTSIVLAAIAILGLWVVKLSLRPLDAIGATAAAIADGDLTQRVELADEHTEVGRLGLALNSMLTQIEAAFNARAASEQRLRRFVADASHELRTPLAAIRAYAELFTRGADRRPDDLARSMRGITAQSERMSLLVDDLLLLARLDEGRPLELKPVELERIVGEAVETAKTVDPERPIELMVDHAVVLGDRERLRQIIDNLLSNTRAHTPPATPVSVSVKRVNGNALIEVADTGPGMDREQVDRVFERFYRADPSRSRANGGVGLGLSIVSAVAHAHGGRVSASSEPGHGAAFVITLPLLAEDS